MDREEAAVLKEGVGLESAFSRGKTLLTVVVVSRVEERTCWLALRVKRGCAVLVKRLKRLHPPVLRE